MIQGTVSIKSVIDKLSRDMNLQVEDRYVSVIEWSAEALSQIGFGSQYENKEKEIKIKDYKGLLPCDFVKIIGVSLYHEGVEKSKSARTPLVNNIAHQVNDSGLVYTINGSWINTGFREGSVIIFYQGIMIDEEGFPLMPDNISYLEACFWYCVMKMSTPDLMAGKPNGYQFAEQRWHHYCSQARGKHLMPSYDQMESLKRQWIRMIPVINAHSTEYGVLNRNERAKI